MSITGLVKIVVAASLMSATVAAAQRPARFDTADNPSANSSAAQEAFRLIDTWLAAQQTYHHIPALSVGVVVGERLVWAKGYGVVDPSGRIPADARTLYPICSITKLFTSIAVMQQVEAGKLRLDDPITTYLPWATLRPAAGASGPVTLRGVLTRASGLPREADFAYWAAPDFVFPTREQIRLTIGNEAMAYPAERYFQYSNLGMVLAGEATATVAGEPWDRYVRAHILDPLGMAATRTDLPLQLLGKQIPYGYGWLRADATRARLKPFDVAGLRPAAGIVSNVEDLARFAEWQFRLLRTEQSELLAAPTLREMQRVQFVDPGWKVTRGLGFNIYREGDQTFVGHNGECPGYYTQLVLHPATGAAVIALIAAAEPTEPIVKGVFGILAKRRASQSDGVPPTPVDLEAYAGTYSDQPWGADVAILPWGNDLVYLDIPNDDPAGELFLLKPKGGDVFRRLRDDGSEAEEVHFERDARGRVTRLVYHNLPMPKLK